MRRFVFSILLVAAVLLAVDRTGGMVMHWVLRHSQDVLCPKLVYIQDSIHEEVVLLGTSRRHHHYVPGIISDSLGKSVYNAGVGGAGNIFSHYIMLSHILAHYTPRTVCLDVTTADYSLQEHPFSAISCYAPLFGTNREADSVFSLAHADWPYLVSHLFRYNAKASSNLWGLLLNRQKDSDRGYIPLPCPRQHLVQPAIENSIPRIDTLKLEYLRKFIARCQQRSIRLVLVVSPKYSICMENTYAALQAIAQEQGIPFVDYHSAGLYLNHPEYFKDASHLWDQGAKVFSARFAADLRNLPRTGCSHRSKVKSQRTALDLRP